MLKLEEYIEKRKSEDRLNEFDSSLKISNIKTCINYVFEYFDSYLPIQGVEKRTVYENEKLQKYGNSISKYSSDIREWLLSIYETYEKQINQSITRYLTSDESFYLLYCESEFRSISYECYAHIVKRNPFLKNQTEMLYKFIREYHIIASEHGIDNMPNISVNITNWLKSTLLKYNVDISKAIERYLSIFFDNQDSWNARDRIKLDKPSLSYKYQYNYRKKTNLFNINTFINIYGDKPFFKGKKKQIEILMMYIWLHSIEGDEDYWDDYLLQYENY